MQDSDFSMYCIFFGNEELSMDEIRTECVKERWVPLACISKIGEEKKSTICFHNINIASDFIRRNYKGKDSIGVIYVTATDREIMSKRGFNNLFYDWPKKIDLSKDVLSIEIFELGEEPHIVVM